MFPQLFQVFPNFLTTGKWNSLNSTVILEDFVGVTEGESRIEVVVLYIRTRL